MPHCLLATFNVAGNVNCTGGEVGVARIVTPGMPEECEEDDTGHPGRPKASHPARMINRSRMTIITLNTFEDFIYSLHNNPIIIFICIQEANMAIKMSLADHAAVPTNKNRRQTKTSM